MLDVEDRGLVKTLRACCCGRFVGRLHHCMHGHKGTPHGRGAARNHLRKLGPNDRLPACCGLKAWWRLWWWWREVQAPTAQHIVNTNRVLDCHVATLIDPAVGQWYISPDVPPAIVLKRTSLQCKRSVRFVEHSSSRPAFVRTAPSQTTANPRH